MKGLVLAAGRGERLRPLTDTLPKPLVPVCGRACVEPLLETLAAAGITEVAINTHWLPERLHAHLGDGSRWGVRLTWQHEPELLDGLGTLKSFEGFFGDEPVVCVNADIVMDLDLPAVIATHRRSGAAMTLVATPVEGPLKYPVGWDETGRLRAIRRTGFEGAPPLRLGEFTGIHIFEPTIWRDHVPPDTKYHLTLHLCPDLFAKGVPVAVHEHHGLWADIGDRAALDRAHAQVLAARSERYLGHATRIARAGVWLAEGARVEGDVVPPVYVGAGAVVEPGATLGPWGALGAGVRLGAGERVSGGVVVEVA